MTKVYKTAAGQQINMDKLRLLNEKEIAVGNMRTNARGDEIDNSGNIIKSRNEILKDHYNKRGKL
jgi:hypothetical protein